MRRIISLIGLAISMVLTLQAQDFDVTQHQADMKTFIFDNNRNTVKGFILLELEQKTSCCGSDRIYLEVRVDPSGYVLHAKPLTGKNDCFKNSAVDIVKNVKWNASDLRGPKAVYLEIKPNIESCDGRDNVYKKLPIYHNEKLDSEGNLAKGGVAASSSNQPPKTTPQPPKTEPTKPDTPPAKDPVVTAPPKTTDPVVSQPKPKPQEPKKEEPKVTPTPPVTTPSTPVASASSDEMPQTEPQPQTLDEAKAAADQKRSASEEEIRMLRDKLANMREQEASRQRKEAARQAKIEERRRAREAAEEEKRNRDAFGNSADLFSDDAYGASDSDSGDGFGAADNGGDQESQMQQQIEELRSSIQEIADRNRQREDEIRAALEAQQEANREIVRIEEEIAARQEDVERFREEKELAQIEEDRVRVEEEQLKDQDEYQRLIDEINRLQSEAEAKIAELESKKKELENMDKIKNMREQEIALQRQKRETERKLYLEQVRLSLASQGTPVVALSDETTAPAGGQDLMALIPDMTAEVDSEKLKILVNAMTQMQLEIQRLQEQIRLLGGTPATPSSSNSNPYVSPTGSGNKAGTKDTKKNGQRNAGTDNSWKDIDYTDPSAEPGTYNVVPPPNQNPSRGNDAAPAEGFKPGRGYDPDPSHKNTHVNTSGSQFAAREYVGGKMAMKDFIKGQLKDGGICGFAQAVVSVTLDPEGNVTGNQVLASNSDMVKLQLGSILPKLKFNEAQVRYNQTIYLEFKAEILCAGKENEVNLQEVESIIKND
ncbi:MAG: hypothetical protein AAFP89_01435 [Bacteroidota bacterium]